MSPLETLGFALGTSFASGLNLYLTVAAAGVLQRLGIVQLPESLQVLAHPVVLGIALTLFVVEFVADKVPYVIALVDLPEGARILTNIVGCDPAEVEVGCPVALDWEPLSDGRHLAVFRLA